MNSFENWAVSFGALYCIGGIQGLFSTALVEGGPLAMWSNWIIACMLTYTIATSLGEICSAYPTAGSMYYWAFRCAGDSKLAPFLSWIVAWLTALAWITSVASDVTGGAQLLMNEPVAFNVTGFDADLADFTACATQFGFSTLILAFATILNLIHQKHFVYVYYVFAGLMIVSFVMNVVWLPAAVSRSYGFQDSAFVWTATINDVSGVSMGYSWFLSFLFPLSTLVGFDASGHVAEETKNASVEAPHGIVNSMIWSAVICFPVMIVWLYCLPDIDDFVGSSFSSNVQIIYMYQQALGNSGQVVIVAISIALWMLNAAITLGAASRLIYAIARDGLLPFRSSLLARNKNNQPYGAVLFTSGFALVLLLTVLPSQYAFASITSTSVISNIAAYAFIIGGRITFTRTTFVQGPYNLGKWSIAIGYIAVLFCMLIFVVLCLPTSYPVSATTLNYAPVIFIIWMFVCIVYWIISAHRWYKGPARLFMIKDNEETEAVSFIVASQVDVSE
ncbi:hypothetical protein HK100_002046 [Physocladia obscura]|uniref:Amino acid transporter n=1 Tax=Physocladia obscura TaxID=109957 RepID=A0AAD5SW88_9FUNG|nr:hypothetical protein HK100_002046 [Physocladia obscura]